MDLKTENANNLFSKDVNTFKSACKDIIENKDFETFLRLCEGADNIFDFIKEKINKGLFEAINGENFKNVFVFMKLYCLDFEEFIINSLVKFANEDLTDTLLEIFEHGDEDEKTYCAAYFERVNDPLALDLLNKYALSDNEALAANCAKALFSFGDKTLFSKAVEELNKEDEKALRAVEFLASYADKEAFLPMFNYMKKSLCAPNVALALLEIKPFEVLINEDVKSALEIYDVILNAYPEDLPLSTLGFYGVFGFIDYLFDRAEKSPYVCRLILNTKLKFEVFISDDIYTFDLDKNLKNFIKETYDKLQKYNYDFCQNNLKEELLNEDKSRILAALLIIGDLSLAHYAQDILNLAHKSEDEIVICESVLALKKMNALDKLNKEGILNRLQNEHIKAIVASYFN